jgi:hypothetical protein
MDIEFRKLFSSCIIFLLFFNVSLNTVKAGNSTKVHVWEMHEIILNAEKEYKNYYTDVTCWVELSGPDFSKRIYGFWNGGNIFIVRIVATKQGKWQWTSGSDQPDDKGFNRSGEFTAVSWTEKEKVQNPNRRGFIRPTPNGHALQYADGTPFFMIGDTWLAGATWRLPFRGAEPAKIMCPDPESGLKMLWRIARIRDIIR